MGRVVGVTLIVLGVYVVYALIRYREDFRMRSRWMLVFARRHASAVPARSRQPHRLSSTTTSTRRTRGHHETDDDAGSRGDGLRTKTHTHHHSHTDPFMNYGTGTSLAVGALHGVGAETPTQVLIFLAAAGAGGAGAGVITLAVFLVGLFAANTVLAVASASGFLAATKRFAVYATVSVITAAASLVLGVSLRPRQGRLAARPVRRLTLRPAALTNTDDREVPAIDLEAVVALDRPDQRFELRRRELLDVLAALADEVLVVLVREVVHRAAVAEVDVVDDAELLECVERPVDGGDVHRREPALHLRRDVVRRHVPLRR